MDHDSAESANIGSEQPFDGGRKVDPAFKRNILIIGGIFGAAAIVVAALVMMRSGKTEKPGSNVDLGLAQATQGNPEGEQLSPAMKSAITAKLEAERKKKLAEGQAVVMPTETVEPVQSIEKTATPSPATVDQTMHPAGTTMTPPPPALSPEETARLAMRRQGLANQVGALLTVMDGSKQAPARLTFSPAQQAAQQQASQAPRMAQAPGGSAQTVSFTPAKPSLVIDEGEIVAAEVASPIDTYRTNYASARIVAGKLDGAILFGSCKQQEEGLQIQYTRMRVGDQTYVIDAIALDQKTSTDAMDASVDRRYLQRWVFPVLSAAVGGFMRAKSQTGSTVVVLGADGTGVAVPAPNADQARAAAGAAAFGIVQREVDREAAKPYQLRLDANTPIGILFRQPVAAKVAASVATSN